MTQLALALFVKDTLRRASEPDPDTQNGKILAALRRGERLTPKDALARFGTMRLGARIYELKEAGFEIDTEMVKVAPRTTVACYSIKK